MGFKCLTCCELDFLAGGILCVALNLILRCKFSQNLPTNDSLQKDQLKLQVPENCILPGFFKILPPRRHSLGQRELKGCGILSFSPSLYIEHVEHLLSHDAQHSGKIHATYARISIARPLQSRISGKKRFPYLLRPKNPWFTAPLLKHDERDVKQNSDEHMTKNNVNHVEKIQENDETWLERRSPGTDGIDPKGPTNSYCHQVKAAESVLSRKYIYRLKKSQYEPKPAIAWTNHNTQDLGSAHGKKGVPCHDWLCRQKLGCQVMPMVFFCCLLDVA